MLFSILLRVSGFFLPFVIVVILLWRPFRSEKILGLLRNSALNSYIFLIAIGCFFYKISHAVEADFAGHRRAIIQFFAALAVLSLFFSRGFLGVRGLAILELLWANYALREFAGHFSWPFLLIKLGIYGIVVVAMYLAIAPERLRDWLVGPFLQKVKKK